MKNKKNLVLIFALIALIIVVIVVVSINPFKKKEEKIVSDTTLEESIASVAINYYEDFYSKLDNPGDALKDFSEVGLTKHLTELNEFKEFDTEIANTLKEKECDYNTSKIIIYPEDPYGEKDYTFEVILDCKSN